MTTLEDNIRNLDVYLERFRKTGIQNRIAGKDAAGGAGVFQTISPVDKRIICNVAHGTAEDIDQAARAAGCTVVHKPAEATPLPVRLLVEIAEEAGLPPGALNTVNGFGDGAGKALCEHPLIKAIAFVGESRTGSLITRQGADTLKRNHLELGGKNPVIVFEDADLDRALDAVIFMIYSINGERCTSSSRLLIQDTICEEFEARLIARVNNIKVGHPLDPLSGLGPLVSEEHYNKVTSYIEIYSRNESG